MMRLLVLLALCIATPVLGQPPLVEAELVDDIYSVEAIANDELFNGCSLGCAYGWSTEASSVLAPQGENTYSARLLEDGSARTAWVEGVDGDGIGEGLTFTILGDSEVDGERVHDPVPLWGIDLVNGYAKSEASWAENGRVRELLMTLNGEPVRILRLLDSAQIQGISLGEGLYVKPGDVIELTIRAVYPGSRYADTAISELVWFGAH